jgi:hypothetical protein
VGLSNDLGLLAEEYDVSAKRQVGNFPQAFSHVSLVNAAFNLSGHPSMEDQDVSDVHLLRATGHRFGRSRPMRPFLSARGADLKDAGPRGRDPKTKTRNTNRRRAR